VLDSILVSQSSDDALELPCWSSDAAEPALSAYARESVGSPAKIRRQTIVVDIKVEEDLDDSVMLFGGEMEDDAADDMEVEDCLSSERSRPESCFA
jgi:hypothetical protein